MDEIINKIITNFRKSSGKDLIDKMFEFLTEDNCKTDSVGMDFELLRESEASQIGFTNNKRNNNEELFAIGSSSKSMNNFKMNIYCNINNINNINNNNNNNNNNNCMLWIILRMIYDTFAIWFVFIMYLMFVFIASFSCIFRFLLCIFVCLYF